MSFYDDASIVLIPSGYKTSKLYSQKPTDGSGDLTFTRTGSTATRVNEIGLIERCRTNQVIFSEDFTNADWKKLYATVTGNTTISPNGTLTADSIFDNSSNQNHFAYKDNVSLSAGVYTVSYYAKADTLSHCAIGLQTGSTLYSSGNFNLINGTISGAGVNGLSPGNIVSVGNGWYRVSFSANVTTGTFFIFAFTSNGTSTTYIGSGQSFYIWGYQLEIGDIATDYIPTTSAAVTVGPIANLPRLDYTGGGCPKLLMEPTRTNLITYSQQFDNSAWTKRAGITTTANYSISPDGYQNADRIQKNATDGYLYQIKTLSPSTIYTFSIYAKGTGNLIFNIYDGTSAFLSSPFTLSSQWQRFTFTITTNSVTSAGDLGVLVGNDAQLYGAQLEAGSYATSYIPTFNASVTRNADSASKTGISSLIGQTEGTIYWEGEIKAIPLNVTIFGVEKAATSSVIRLHFDAIGVFKAQCFNGISNLFFVEGPAIQINTRYKFAFSYKKSDYAFYVNGILIATGSNSTDIPTCDKLETNSLWGTLGSTFYTTNQALLFKTRLSNSDLATLTTI